MAPTLPDGIEIELVNDTSVRVKNALENLQTNAIAGGFVVIVLWMFIGIRIAYLLQSVFP